MIFNIDIKNFKIMGNKKSKDKQKILFGQFWMIGKGRVTVFMDEGSLGIGDYQKNSK